MSAGKGKGKTGEGIMLHNKVLGDVDSGNEVHNKVGKRFISSASVLDFTHYKPTPFSL